MPQSVQPCSSGTVADPEGLAGVHLPHERGMGFRSRPGSEDEMDVGATPMSLPNARNDL